jgi:hypothetical protein
LKGLLARANSGSEVDTSISERVRGRFCHETLANTGLRLRETSKNLLRAPDRSQLFLEVH